MPMTGRALIRLIIAHATLYGLMCHHMGDSRRLWPGAAPGFPDLVLAGPAGVAFREIKGAGDRLTPAQSEWGAVLIGTGHDWRVWHWADWAAGTIQADIYRLAGRAGAERLDPWPAAVLPLGA